MQHLVQNLGQMRNGGIVSEVFKNRIGSGGATRWLVIQTHLEPKFLRKFDMFDILMCLIDLLQSTNNLVQSAARVTTTHENSYKFGECQAVLMGCCTSTRGRGVRLFP